MNITILVAIVLVAILPVLFLLRSIGRNATPANIVDEARSRAVARQQKTAYADTRPMLDYELPDVSVTEIDEKDVIINKLFDNRPVSEESLALNAEEEKTIFHRRKNKLTDGNDPWGSVL